MAVKNLSKINNLELKKQKVLYFQKVNTYWDIGEKKKARCLMKEKEENREKLLLLLYGNPKCFGNKT